MVRKSPKKETNDPSLSQAQTTFSNMGLALRLMGLGWAIAVPAVAFTVLGFWLDNMFGTSPLLLIVGLILGVLVGAFVAMRLVKAFFKNPKTFN